MTISATKSLVILRRVPLHLLNFGNSIMMKDKNENSYMDEDASLSIEIYFQLKPVLSLLLNYITFNFSHISVWP